MNRFYFKSIGYSLFLLLLLQYMAGCNKKPAGDIANDSSSGSTVDTTVYTEGISNKVLYILIDGGIGAVITAESQ
jgi:hypothetical protein